MFDEPAVAALATHVTGKGIDAITTLLVGGDPSGPLCWTTPVLKSRSTTPTSLQIEFNVERMLTFLVTLHDSTRANTKLV